MNGKAAERSRGTRYPEVRRVTLAGIVVNLALGVVKVATGLAAHSQALLADGLHSLSDLATDFIVLYAARHAHREADREHPYGHGRIETLATVGLGAALLAVAVGIGYDAIRRLFQPQLLMHPGFWALAVALFSILSKEILFHYTLRVARRTRSRMLRANAWHHRSDAISSVIVVIGVAGSMAGLEYLDAIAAVAVAVMIAKIAFDLGMRGLRELIDTALEEGEVSAIRRAILQVHGVRALHTLRTRRSGSDVLVDVHLLVEPTLSVSEGHQIGEKVRTGLIDAFEEITDVTVHIDPEDDEVQSPSSELPLRGEVLARLHACWEGTEAGGLVEDVTLHYLKGRVYVDVVLPLAEAADAERAGRLSRELSGAAGDLEEIGGVEVYYH